MKKQIAVLMAAATAVTTVAPAIANADVKLHEKTSAGEVNAEIKKALGTRYESNMEDGLGNSSVNSVKEYQNSRYIVVLETEKSLTDKELETYGLHKYESPDAYPYKKIDTDLTEAKATLKNCYVVEDANDVKPLIEKLMATPDKGQSVTTKVYVSDKGIEGKSAFRVTKNKHLVAGKTEAVKDKDTEVGIESLRDEFIKAAKSTKTFVKDGENGVSALKKDGSFEVKLKNDTTLKFKLNDDAVRVDKPITKAGQTLDVKIDGDDYVVHNTQAVVDEVEKFELDTNKDDQEVKVDVSFGDIDTYVVSDVELTNFDLGTIYTKAEGYTQAGADLINKIIVARRGDEKDGKAKFSFNHAGVNYILASKKEAGYQAQAVRNDAEAKAAVHTGDAEIDKVGDHYELRINVDVLDKNDNDRFKTLQFKFEGKTQEDLARVLADLKGNTEVVVGKFSKLAGANRFETAIEVSKERFGYEEANTVVIVGANALMDGLSAAPLAAAKKAPVLLADAKTGLGRSTMDEIGRACKNLNRKTVYVVGGVNSVPQSVVKQLEDKFGAVVVRLAGDTRYDTSLEVASRLLTDKQVNGELFVVGGEGAADAMSVSAVAAKAEENKATKLLEVSPILVVEKSGIKRTHREFIKKNKLNTLKNANQNIKNTYLIGGETTASSQVFRDLQETLKKNPVADNASTDVVKRLAGENRYETNVKVINEFYGTVKKDADKRINMIEGLDITSGDNKYLVDAQTAGAFAAENNAAILLTGSSLTKDQKDLLKDMKLKTGVYQVGGVVSANVMKEVVDILGL